MVGRMPHREFVDARGQAWQAWDVVPKAALFQLAPERRERRERRIADSGPPAGVAERRQAGGDRRGFGGADMRRGWLAFMSEGDHRRLAPIPPQWDQSTEEQMRSYLGAARRVRPLRTHRAIGR